MPEDHRLFQANRSEPAVVVVMEIGAADAPGRQPQPDLTRPRLALGDLFDADVLGRVDDNGFHRGFLFTVRLSGSG